MLEKFPVVSKNGIEYLATLETYENIMNDENLRVRLYVMEKRKFLWMEKERFVGVHTAYFEDGFLHKYVDAIKYAVERYEESIQEKHELKKKLQKDQKDGTKQLEEWDGVCR